MNIKETLERSAKENIQQDLLDLQKRGIVSPAQARGPLFDLFTSFSDAIEFDANAQDPEGELKALITFMDSRTEMREVGAEREVMPNPLKEASNGRFVDLTEFTMPVGGTKSRYGG